VALTVVVLVEWRREWLLKATGELARPGRDSGAPIACAAAPSAHSAKPLVAHLKQQRIRLLLAGTRQGHELLAVSLLQAVLQHWTIDLA